MDNILILGSSGFVGSNLVNFFYKKKYTLSLFDIKDFNIRKYPKAKFNKKNILDFSESDLPKKDFIVINVAALLGSKNYNDNMTNNVLTLKRIVKVLENKKNLKGFIHFSSISAQRRVSHYGHSKFKSEMVIRNSNLPYIILQSEMIIGKKARSMEKIIKISKFIPFFLPFPRGGNIFRYPIDIKNVIEIVDDIINSKKFDRKTYSLISKKILFSSLLKKITKKKIIHLPPFLILTIAKILEKTFKNPFFTYDNAYGICNSTKIEYPKYIKKNLSKK